MVEVVGVVVDVGGAVVDVELDVEGAVVVELVPPDPPGSIVVRASTAGPSPSSAWLTPAPPLDSAASPLATLGVSMISAQATIVTSTATRAVGVDIRWRSVVITRSGFQDGWSER